GECRRGRPVAAGPRDTGERHRDVPRRPEAALPVMTTALVLVVLAVVLAGPGPLWVARWRWLHQVPRSAVALWQAGAVAALVAVIGAGVVVLRQLPLVHGPGWWIVALLLLVFIGHVVARLVWFGLRELRRSGVRRR